MIPALIIGRAGSSGFPSKNITSILGRPLMAYPILAAQNSKMIDANHIYISTDSNEIKEIAIQYGCKLIQRPDALATSKALAEDAFIHGYEYIRDLNSQDVIEFIVLLFCNGATITPGIIDKGISVLRTDPLLDSAVTVSQYNMWSPLRAKKIENDRLRPWGSLDVFQNASCDRSSQGDTYFADCSAFACRPRCLERGYGELPFRWMGRNVYPLKQWGGLDVDYEWQMGQVAFWLREHGFSETHTPYS